MKKEARYSLLQANDRLNSRKINSKNAAFPERINKRANGKQALVADTFRKVLGEDVDIREIALCKKELTFPSLKHLDNLFINYHLTNTLIAKVFDLIVKTHISSNCTQDSSCADSQQKERIHASFSGGIKIANVSLTSTSGSPIVKELVQRLNDNDLFKSRLLFLEATDFRIVHDTSHGQWDIELVTGKGSTAWCLFPPATMYIPLTEGDAMRMIELFQIVIYEIRNLEKSMYMDEAG